MACCAKCRPKWQRLVDNIYPKNTATGDGLVKSNMEKLIYYAQTKPEKLDRIGQYLCRQLNYDVARQKYRDGYIYMSMDAMDQLLKACHSQMLNIFIESFLRMVEHLLEQTDPALQRLATQSFCNFAVIKEEIPSYHRSYDFLIDKFATMCHSEHDDDQMKIMIRLSGLKGLQGVVTKAGSDRFQEIIWAPAHMDKIVPSYIFNMHDVTAVPPGSSCVADAASSSLTVGAAAPTLKESEEGLNGSTVNLMAVSESGFRDLVSRADYSSIRPLTTSVLTHLDNHSLWVPNTFAKSVFKVIMTSCQAQYDYTVVQILMQHLDRHIKHDPKIKTAITEILLSTLVIAASESVGPSQMTVVNTLMKHLKYSSEVKVKDNRRYDEERHFQQVLVHAVGDFAKSLPDYDQIAIIDLIMSKIPANFNEIAAVSTANQTDANKRTSQLVSLSLKAILEIAIHYNSKLLSNALQDSFLMPLLKLGISNVAGIRLCVQKILQTLLDRNQNAAVLSNQTKIFGSSILEVLTINRHPLQQDILFLNKSGPWIFSNIIDNSKMLSNKVDNFEQLYITLMLLAVEIPTNEALLDLIALVLVIQRDAVSNKDMPVTHKCAVHAVVAALMSALVHILAEKDLIVYVNTVIGLREAAAPHLLPRNAFNRSNTPQSYPDGSSFNYEKSEWLFIEDKLSQILQHSKTDLAQFADKILSSQLEIRRPLDYLNPDVTDGRSISEVSIASITSSLKSDMPDSSGRALSNAGAGEVWPQQQQGIAGGTRRPTAVDLSFDAAKAFCSDEHYEERKRIEREEMMRMREKYKTTSFEKIVSDAQEKLADYIERRKQLEEIQRRDRLNNFQYKDVTVVPLDEIEFPSIFAY